MPTSTSLSVRHQARVNVLTSQVWVSEAFDPNDSTVAHPALTELRAIWDTGATNTCITSEVAARMGLVQTGAVKTNSAQGEWIAATFLVHIKLHENITFPALTVTECKLPAGADLLIGMDIIGSGDFAVTNHEDKTVMTFRSPSCKCIDFVVEHNSDAFKERTQALIKTRQHSSRNPPKKAGRGKPRK